MMGRVKGQKKEGDSTKETRGRTARGRQTLIQETFQKDKVGAVSDTVDGSSRDPLD